MRTLGWDSKQCQAAARILRSLSVRVLEDMVVGMALVLLWVGWLMKGFGGVGRFMLYEDWLEVDVVDVVVSSERRSGRLDRLMELADVCASIPMR